MTGRLFEIASDRSGFPCAKWEQDGFTLELSSELDSYADYSHLGKWSDTFEEGAIRNKRSLGNSNFAKWFIPGTSYQYHFDYYQSEMSYTKAESDRLARQHVQEDYDRLSGWGDEWDYLCFCVTASRKGVELGRSFCGGIESDSDDQHFRELVRDLAGDAIAEAKDTLSALIESTK